MLWTGAMGLPSRTGEKYKGSKQTDGKYERAIRFSAQRLRKLLSLDDTRYVDF